MIVDCYVPCGAEVGLTPPGRVTCFAELTSGIGPGVKADDTEREGTPASHCSRSEGSPCFVRSMFV